MTYNIGKILLVPKGGYNSNTTYQPLDFVTYNGSSYVCKSANTVGKVPTNTTYWQLLAQAGQAVLTPQQQAEIIQALTDSGVVIDANYNTFTTAEKTKLAGLSNANNGTLTITTDGRQLGTFSANQSTNNTINIPTPGNGIIKLVRADNDAEIGTFSTNQKEDNTIKIPIGSGGGSANNGVLTLKQGTTTLGTFSADQSTNTTLTISNQSLTIQANGTTIDTYNPAAAKTINITVPTSMSDLTDGTSYPTYRGYSSDSDNTTEDTLTGDCKIGALQSNYVYYCSHCTALRVDSYDYDVTDEVTALQMPATYIFVEAGDDFDIALSDLDEYKLIRGCSTSLTNGCSYLITVIGYVWRIEMLA